MNKNKTNNIVSPTTEACRRKRSLIWSLAICGIYAMMLTTTVIAFATSSNYSSWLTPFESFINTCISFISLIGKGILLWAFFEVSAALFSHDVSSIPQALRRIGGGCLLVFVEPLLNAMIS